MLDYEKIMRRAIELAEKAKGFVSPNPLVGAIIVKNDRILSEGYHHKFGDVHAEVDAIRKLSDNELKDSTIIVNLEPCSHYGKTPPCADLIIEKKIAKVVIGMKDPNPLVSGRGIEKLRNAGIEVISGIEEERAKWLNRIFIKNITTKLPYVVLKAAQSLDGKIATSTGESKWISSEESRKFVHKLRAELDAVLVGKNTVKYDNPSLTVRSIEGRNPKKIILDTNLELNPKQYDIYNKNLSEYVIVCYSSDIKEDKNLEYYGSRGIKLLPCKTQNNKGIDLHDCLIKLSRDFNIASILVEGGSEIFSSFIENNLVDELQMFIAPDILGKGKGTFDNFYIDKLDDSVKFKIREIDKTGRDLHIILTK